MQTPLAALFRSSYSSSSGSGSGSGSRASTTTTSQKTWDLEMMYKVQKLVRVPHAEGSALLPGDAPVNRDVLAPTSKL